MKPMTVYVCGVFWQHEFQNWGSFSSGGEEIFLSVEDLKANKTCWKQCGIIEIEMQPKRWVVEQDFSKLEDSDT